jgi:hypothetical protein
VRLCAAASVEGSERDQRLRSSWLRCTGWATAVRPCPIAGPPARRWAGRVRPQCVYGDWQALTVAAERLSRSWYCSMPEEIAGVPVATDRVRLLGFLRGGQLHPGVSGLVSHAVQLLLVANAAPRHWLGGIFVLRARAARVAVSMTTQDVVGKMFKISPVLCIQRASGAGTTRRLLTTSTRIK